MIAKGSSSGGDEIVIDLEDSVVPSEKDAARERLLPMLETIESGEPAVAVRINAPRSPWCHRDLEVLAGAPAALHSIVVPKVESAGDVAFLERLLDGVEAAAGRSRPLGVQLLIETAAGLARVEEIVAASARVEGMILGYADLTASLGRARGGGFESWRGAQERLLVAARANIRQAIDGPFFNLEDAAGLEAACRRAADLGFDGKWAIHPAQIPVINAAFMPSAEQVERARALLAHLRDAEATTRTGAVRFEGEMIDEAMAADARRVLARAEAGPSS